MTRGRGEGSYSRLHDGRWVYQISVGVGPRGSRRRPRFYGATKEEARDRAEDYRRRIRRGDPVLVDRTWLADYLTTWLDGLMIEQSSITNYRSVLTKHVIPRIGHLRIGELRQEHIRKIQRELTEAGVSANTVNRARLVLGIAMTAAMRDGYVDRNAVALVQTLRYSTPRRTPLNADQALAFLRHVRDLESGPFYMTALGLGLRKGELRGLLWPDIAGDVVRVQRQLKTERGAVNVLRDLKTGASGQRDLPLPDFVQQALAVQRDRQRFARDIAGDAWDTEQPDLVFRSPFGRPLSIYAIDSDFAAQLVAAKLPAIPFHALRHSCATLLLSLGVEMRIVQAVLGHSAMRTTEGYAHVLPSLTADAMRRLDALLGSNGTAIGTGSNAR